ncbi:UNVERIFIED_CONTAM: hypothetical protein NCL1_38994 [Trichonephila clavipes]
MSSGRSLPQINLGLQGGRQGDSHKGFTKPNFCANIYILLLEILCNFGHDALGICKILSHCIVDSEEEVIRSLEDHPYLRRQEAIVEDDPSDDSSSETTVLLGRQTESPRNLQQSSSADVSEWEAFNKE